MTEALCYPRRARLLRPADFAALRGHSTRIAGRSFQTQYRYGNTGNARLGMAVSRKVSKLAVVRNRIRRVMRDSFRLHRAQLPQCDILLIAYSAAALQTNQGLRDELELVWRKLAALKEHDPAGTMPAGC